MKPRALESRLSALFGMGGMKWLWYTNSELVVEGVELLQLNILAAESL